METKCNLSDRDIPRQWYNLAADLAHAPLPPLGPDGLPISPEALLGVFPESLIEQEMSRERWIDIPEGVLDLLLRFRPTPLVRAKHLEQALGTPARIYFKNESVSPAGSHKPNTAVAQAWYNKQQGVKRLTTETGAGQWGCALAFASAMLGLECKVFMVRVSFDQKPLRKMMMESYGATCIASPSTETAAGRAVLAEHPDTPGSLGIAISEAVESAVSDASGQTRYALGSVLNHVLLHQTIIGLEAKKQLALLGEKADVVIACAGGGSNFAGIAFPFAADKAHGAPIDIIPVEPASCPTLTRGVFTYDHGDIAGLTPMLPMFTLGREFIPDPIHAGGLRYHGMAPLVSQGVLEGLFSPLSLPQSECFSAALLFSRTEGLLVAPETSHAVAAVVREADKAKQEGREKVILFNLSGHGMMDLYGYEAFLSGRLVDHEPEEEQLAAALAKLTKHPPPRF